MSERKNAISPIIRALEVGESHAFPLVQLAAVRAKASELGLQWNRKYETQTRREERTVTVTRRS